jgi:hypothetical protein
VAARAAVSARAPRLVWGVVLAAVLLAALPVLAQPTGVTDAEILLGASTALSFRPFTDWLSSE